LPATGTPDPFATINTIPRNLVNPQTFATTSTSTRAAIQFDCRCGLCRLSGNAFVHKRTTESGIGGFNITKGISNRGSVVARTNGGDSSYNSVQARLDRGFKNGLLLRFAYTFSKAIDDVNSEVFVTTGGSSVGSTPSTGG
jgi:hypothetical protein